MHLSQTSFFFQSIDFYTILPIYNSQRIISKNKRVLLQTKKKWFKWVHFQQNFAFPFLFPLLVFLKKTDPLEPFFTFCPFSLHSGVIIKQNKQRTRRNYWMKLLLTVLRRRGQRRHHHKSNHEWSSWRCRWIYFCRSPGTSPWSSSYRRSRQCRQQAGRTKPWQ